MHRVFIAGVFVFSTIACRDAKTPATNSVKWLGTTATMSPQTLTTSCGDITVTHNAGGAGGAEEFVIARAGGGATAKVTRSAQRVDAKWQPAVTSLFNPVAELSAQQQRTNICRVSTESEKSSPSRPGPLSTSFLAVEKLGWLNPFNIAAEDPETPLLRLAAVTALSVRRKVRFLPIVGSTLEAALKDDACTAVVMLAVATAQILEIQSGVVIDILPPIKFARAFNRTPADYQELKKAADANPSGEYHLAHLIEQADTPEAVGEAAVGGACGDRRAEAYSKIPKASPHNGVNILVHEVLHQLNAKHSHVNQNDPKLAGSQFEPGDGTSVMSWAMQDRYLHAATVDQVAGFFAGGTCGDALPAAPAAASPVIQNAGLNFTVPSGTPFELATDGTGFSCVRWHEWDSANTKGLPWFRSFESCSAVRMLPTPAAIQKPEAGHQVVAGTQSMRFVGIVNWGRDQVAGGLVQVSVRSSKQPFAVTGADTSCASGSQECVKVSWNGASTKSRDGAQDVELQGSKDGGQSWLVLGTAANADGATSATFPFNVPQICGSSVDLRLKAVKGVIFALAPKPIAVC